AAAAADRCALLVTVVIEVWNFDAISIAATPIAATPPTTARLAIRKPASELDAAEFVLVTESPKPLTSASALASPAVSGALFTPRRTRSSPIVDIYLTRSNVTPRGWSPECAAANA